MSIMLLTAFMTAQAAVPQPATAQPTAVATDPVKEKRICRVDVNESSSRLRKRVCMTQTEWDRKAAGVTGNDLKTLGAR